MRKALGIALGCLSLLGYAGVAIASPDVVYQRKWIVRNPPSSAAVASTGLYTNTDNVNCRTLPSFDAPVVQKIRQKYSPVYWWSARINPDNPREFWILTNVGNGRCWVHSIVLGGGD